MKVFIHTKAVMHDDSESRATAGITLVTTIGAIKHLTYLIFKMN